jgi:hypothetical protein
MTAASPAANELTSTLLKNVREQRHKAIRIVVSTQEPTLNPALLDLCSITFVHRFTSPAWFNVIRKHLAGAHMFEIDFSDYSKSPDEKEKTTKKETIADLFRSIIQLRVGESLLFGPTATMGIDTDGSVQKLNERHIKFRTRMRLTEDGGLSQLVGNRAE